MWARLGCAPCAPALPAAAPGSVTLLSALRPQLCAVLRRKGASSLRALTPFTGFHLRGLVTSQQSHCFGGIDFGMCVWQEHIQFIATKIKIFLEIFPLHMLAVIQILYYYYIRNQANQTKWATSATSDVMAHLQAE